MGFTKRSYLEGKKSMGREGRGEMEKWERKMKERGIKGKNLQISNGYWKGKNIFHSDIVTNKEFMLLEIMFARRNPNKETLIKYYGLQKN